MNVDLRGAFWAPSATILGSASKMYERIVRSIFANGEQGFAYDPNDLDATKLNWRRNLFTETEFRNGLADASFKGGDVSATTFADLQQGTGLRVALSASVAYAYKTIPVALTTGTFSFYIRMQDGGAPVVGNNSNPSADLSIIIAGAASSLVPQIVDLGGGLYRIVRTLTYPLAAGAYLGVAKYTSNSNRTFTVSGWQLEYSEQGTPYQPLTDFNSEFIKAFPLHTLYQDAAGTIPVAAAGQPVGLVLDKSKGLKLGAELFIESDVSIAGQSSKLDGTRYRVYCPDGIESSGIRLMGKFIAGKWYLVEFTIDSVAVAGEGIAAESTQNQLVHKTVGRKRVLVLATNANFYLKRIGVCDYTVSSISVKEIAGNHAYQTVSASRPVLRQTPILGNELVVNGDFSNGLTGWSSAAGFSSTAQVVNGAIEVTPAQDFGRYAQVLNLTAGKTYKISGNVAAKTGAQVYVALGYGTPADSNVVSPLTQTTSLTGFESLFVPTTGAVNVSLSARTGSVGVFDNISVKEVVGYRTDQNYLAFDGIDDFLQTNNIDFTLTDKVSLFAGVRKYVNSVRILCELSSDMNANPNSFYITAPEHVTGTYGFKSRGSAGSIAAMTALTQPTSPEDSCVLVASADISADSNTIRRNGILSATSYELGSGNYGNYPLFIGRRGGLSLPFSGHLYGLVGVGRLTTDGETLAVERELAKQTGVVLNV